MKHAQVVRYGSLRASDADRNRTIDSLNDAYADGRLDHDELMRRTDETLRALTFAELEPITRDLPGGVAVVRRRPGGPVHQARSGQAVASAALGLGGWVGPTFLAWIPAIVLGHQARRDIRRDGTAGYDLTTLGLVSAYVGLALQVICAVVLIVVLTQM